MATRISQSLLNLLAIEIEPGEMTCIGLVSETDIDRVSTIVDGSLE
jgi:hypothetical protein